MLAAYLARIGMAGPPWPPGACRAVAGRHRAVARRRGIRQPQHVPVAGRCPVRAVRPGRAVPARRPARRGHRRGKGRAAACQTTRPCLPPTGITSESTSTPCPSPQDPAS